MFVLHIAADLTGLFFTEHRSSFAPQTASRKLTSGWGNCDPQNYNDGKVCNCKCGGPDPDCVNPDVGPRSPDCKENQICFINTCINMDWDPKCDIKKMGTDGICDCGCGHDNNRDYDCLFPGNPVVTRNKGFVCDEDKNYSKMEGWTCDSWIYNDSECICGQDCGIEDFDCVGVKEKTCKADGTRCLNDICKPIPASYHCDLETYGDGEVCNCGCGAPDPDCKNYDLPVVGCSGKEICPGDTCRISECGNNHLEEGEECDGGQNCRQDCTCRDGYKSVGKADCIIKCGDGVVDPGEDCDKTAHCTAKCKCEDGTTAVNGTCTKETDSNSGNKSNATPVIVGVAVGAVVAVAIIVIVAIFVVRFVAILCCRKK